MRFLIKLCFLNFLTATLALAQPMISLDRLGQKINKIYFESKTVKDFVRAVPTTAEDKSDLIHFLELNNLSSAPLPLMQVELGLNTTTYIFAKQLARLEWRIKENKFFLNGKGVDFNPSMKWEELHRRIKKNLLPNLNAGWPTLLLPKAEAEILTDIVIVAIIGVIIKGIEYQQICDKINDRLCFIGLNPNDFKKVDEPKKSLAQSFWSGHLPSVFLCSDTNFPAKVAAIFPLAIKGMKGGPADYNEDKPREIELNYSNGKLNSFKISRPFCSYNVDRDGNMVPRTNGEKKCQVPYKMPARQFLAYAGLWLQDAENCCKDSCKNEVQKIILEQSRMPQPKSSGVGI